MMYPETIVNPMKAELTMAGFQELVTPEEVDNAVNLKMGNSIQARAMEEVKRHIRFLSKSPEKKMSIAAPNGDLDNSDSSEDSLEDKEEKIPIILRRILSTYQN